MAHSSSGDGPGIQTPDGCSVNLYRQLPYMGELKDIEDHLLRHTSVLELGCGTGRLCGRLQELGLHTTGVDESTEMLAHLPAGIEGINSTIEALDLARRWPAVLLPSHLINHPDPSTRRQFVEVARRHLSDNGSFYVKRHSPRWLSTVERGQIGESSGIALYADEVARDGNLVTLTIRYSAPEHVWTQKFTTCALDQHEIESLLSSCGFRRFEWFGSEALWVAANPSDA
jgi:SAM-dependent methyltransferase